MSFFFIIGCQTRPDTDRPENNLQELIGCWSSFRITYPDDPIFKDTPPDEEVGSAKLQLARDGRFIYISKNVTHSGIFQVHGKKLIFTSDKEEETIRCEFELKGNQLTLLMNDGFKFDFNKVNIGAEEWVPKTVSSQVCLPQRCIEFEFMKLRSLKHGQPAV